MDRMLRGFAGGLVAWLMVAIPAGSGAGEVYFYKTVAELTATEGRLREGRGRLDTRLPDETAGHYRARGAAQPYVVIEGGGEVFLDRAGSAEAIDRRGERRAIVGDNGLWTLERDDVVAFRIPEEREVKGRLFFSEHDGSGKVHQVAFKVKPPEEEQKDAKVVFASTKGRHYERLLRRNLPGAAWFRHQMIAARALLPAGPEANPMANTPAAWTTGVEGTFLFFSGGRAIDENLQLDRQATPVEPANPRQAVERTKIGTLKGITVAEMDFAARLKGRSPTLDPLAASIPADQHALFLPGLEAAAALLAESQGDTFPVLNLASQRSEDRGVVRRYERQVGVSLADLGRFPGRDGIKSLAVTGSDPDLPGGTDLAILIEAEAPDELTAFLKNRVDQARHGHPDADDDADDAGGEVDGVRYHGARTPDRALSAYVAAIGPVVVVTNSTVQLRRLVDAAHDKTPRLADAPEYRFFRDRYARGEGDESAFLVLTDATIRRWCGPTWRIGASRRVRAALAMAEVQAEDLPAVVNEATKGRTPKAPPGAIDLGALHFGPSGVRSETYGTLDFQTPVVELSIAEVDRDEADAYNAWRDTYQQNWRGVFDPIAVRLSVRPGRSLAADVSVMPLIVASDYKPYLDVVGNVRLAPEAGDRHPGTLAHAVMAIDAQARPFRRGGEQISRIADIAQQVALGWLGSSAAVYLDDDPFWAELATAGTMQKFVIEHYDRLPVGFQVEVTSAARLALFLAGIRGFVEQAAPDLTKWEIREHQGEHYVRVGEPEGARPGGNRPTIALYYYASPRSLTISLSEGLIRRAIDRQGAEADGPTAEPAPWLGRSLAGRVSRRGFEVFDDAARSEFRYGIQARSWGNLPILNEWKRLFPDRDPVAVHEAVWGTTLVDPGGGRYVWNARWATMESTAFGHPGEPKPGRDLNNPVGRIGSAALGLSFEDGGVRARTEVELLVKP